MPYYHQYKQAALEEFAKMAEDYSFNAVIEACDQTIQMHESKNASALSDDEIEASMAASAIALSIKEAAYDALNSGIYDEDDRDYRMLDDVILKVAKKKRDAEEEESLAQRAMGAIKRNPGKALAGAGLTAAGVLGGRAALNSNLAKDIRSINSARKDLLSDAKSQINSDARTFVGGRLRQGAVDTAGSGLRGAWEGAKSVGRFAGDAITNAAGKAPKSSLQLTEDDVIHALGTLKQANLIDDSIISQLLG